MAIYYSQLLVYYKTALRVDLHPRNWFIVKESSPGKNKLTGGEHA